MIPTTVSGPIGAIGASSRPQLARIAVLFLFLIAVIGAMAWTTRLSPFQLDRWSARDTSHPVSFTTPGTYTLFEEAPGAAAQRGDAEVVVSVRSIAGRALPVRSLIDDRGRSQQTYDVGLRQGRAIAAIDVDRPGRYVIVSFPATRDPTNRRGGRETIDLPGLALGPEGVPSSWGTWSGLVLFAGIPAALGAVLLAWAHRHRPLPLGPVLVSPQDGRTRPVGP